ncbi:MAG: hypothetical protein ACJASL_000948 [Paraglaciecola sp.]|jgi:hypothetical protein
MSSGLLKSQYGVMPLAGSQFKGSNFIFAGSLLLEQLASVNVNISMLKNGYEIFLAVIVVALLGFIIF